jgi:hypothetical protein|nr:MAG TPA: PcfK-like protein [Caudoviricetes sp.]
MEGIERIKKLSQEQKDTNIKKVAEYLINREDLNEKFLNEEKNLTDMWDYIKKQAKEKAINGCAVIEDEEVYGLAVHYFDETNETLGIKIDKKEIKQDVKVKEDTSKIKENTPIQEEVKAEVPTHKDDDIVMKYKGRDITYKEFKDGTYLQLS